jgi:hypothetical protein
MLLSSETTRALWRILWTVNLSALTLDHLLTGLMGMLSPRKAIAIYSRIFGVQFPASPELLLVMRPWGALGVFAGLVTLFPILDPARYKGILVALLLLLCIRLVIRASLGGAANKLIFLSNARNRFHLFLIFVCAILISSELLLL